MTAVRVVTRTPWIDPEILKRDTERRRAALEADTSFIDADWKTTQLKTLELYRADATCFHCKKLVEGPHYATALQYRESGDWKLFHDLPSPCAMDAIIAENRRRAEAEA